MEKLNFKADFKTIQKAVKGVSGFASTKKTRKILTMVDLAFEGDTLTLSATDSNIAIRFTLTDKDAYNERAGTRGIYTWRNSLADTFP